MFKRTMLALVVVAAFAASATAATEKWIAGSGQGLTWGDICGAEVKTTAVSSLNAVLCSVVVANGTALDVFGDFSISLASVTSGAGAPYIGIYLYPLNEDGSTYGDGKFGSPATGPPPTEYFVCSIPVVASVTAAIVGMCRGILLPPGSFKVVFYNVAGVATASSGNTVQYRTYNRSIN